MVDALASRYRLGIFCFAFSRLDYSVGLTAGFYMAISAIFLRHSSGPV
jgi:hypothetical protein